MLDLITPTHNATLARAPIKVNTINATMPEIPFEHGNFYIIIAAFGRREKQRTSALHNALTGLKIHGDNNERWSAPDINRSERGDHQIKQSTADAPPFEKLMCGSHMHYVSVGNRGWLLWVVR